MSVKVKTEKESVSTSCNTSQAIDASPVWSSGSGTIKEIRLHAVEMQVKSLEKENVKLKEHEEFYINKAREWKSRALKYEKTLEKNGIQIPGKVTSENGTSVCVQGAAQSHEQASNAENKDNNGMSPRTSTNPLQDLQNIREGKATPPTPTEDMKLVLTRRNDKPRRTEADFRLSDSQRKPDADNCKTQ